MHKNEPIISSLPRESQGQVPLIGSMISLKLLGPLLELHHACMAEFLQRLRSFLDTTHMVGTGLRVELVSIADNLFFQCLRFIARQSGTSMAFCHTGMAGKALKAEQLTAYWSMLDIRFRTMTMNAGCITLVDANVVQHGSLFHELHINWQLRMLTHNL